MVGASRTHLLFKKYLVENRILKNIYILLFTICTLLGGFTFFKWRAMSVSENIGGAAEQGLNDAKERSSKNLEVNSSIANANLNHLAEDKNWNPMGDAVSSEEIKKWFADRGNYSFFDPDSFSDYQGYDIETLTRLSDSGDIKAMHVLADRANNFADLRSILFKASIYGSTEALIQLGSLNENDEGNLKAKPVEVQKAKILTALAYYEVAQIRGDWWGNIASGKSLTERYKVSLTEQDRLLIKNLSEQIYSDLQARRFELGLGEFDNSVPDSVIKFYEEMVKPL